MKSKGNEYFMKSLYGVLKWDKSWTSYWIICTILLPKSN